MNAVLSRTEASLLGPGNKVTVMDYDDDGNDIPNENPTNIMHRLIEQGFSLNLSGVLTAYEYITQFAYSDKGQVLSIDGPLAGNADTIEFGYDAISADLRMVTRPLIGTTYFLEYAAAGQAGKIIDVNNQSTRLSFDGRGRLTTIFYDADSSASAMTYNIAGLPEVSSDEDRVERYYTYDALYGRLDRIYDVDNNYIEHQYDLQGNLIERSRHDAAGARFGRKRFSFAGAEIPGKLYREINFDDTYTEYHYDGAGNVSLMTDAEGNVTEYRYDAFNRLTEVIQSLDEAGDVVTSYRYDAHGNPASVTDAEGRRTGYEYDDMGRVVAIISADTGTTRYAYDGAGNLVRKTDANGITTQYGYDSLNRLKDIKFPDITQNITYTYDQGQNGVGYRTGMADASGNTLFGYDPRGRLVFKFSTVNAIASWVGRAFTPAGRVQSVIYPSGRRIDYARNGSGKIKAMTTALNGQMTTLVSGLEHNPFGGPAGMNTGYGGAVNNRSGECACLEAANPGAFMEQNYLYDGNRNLLSIRATNTPWLNQDFYYDALNRLIRAGGIYGTIEYTYDKVGNRLTRSINDRTETYRYFPGSNRLSEVSGAPALSYTYDLNGNITGVDDKTLIYNPNNRLIQVKKNDTVLGEYTYNGLGQRILRTADGVTTIFVYDFDGNIIAESRPDGTLMAEYLYLLGNRIARVDVETETFSYYLNNYLGTPLLMTDDTGKVVWEAFYKPFGDAYVNPNSELVNNFRFAGQYYDAETGLHYNYRRYYDPEIGRYLTPDPIGFSSGDINLYSYVSNNPINRFDPLGLADAGMAGWYSWASPPSSYKTPKIPLLGTVDPANLKSGADSTSGPLAFYVAGSTLIVTGSAVTKAGVTIMAGGGPAGWIGGGIVTIIGGTIWISGVGTMYQGYQVDILINKEPESSASESLWGTGTNCVDY